MAMFLTPDDSQGAGFSGTEWLQDKGLLNNPFRRLGLGRTGVQTTEVRRLQDNMKTLPITSK